MVPELIFARTIHNNYPVWCNVFHDGQPHFVPFKRSFLANFTQFLWLQAADHSRLANQKQDFSLLGPLCIKLWFKMLSGITWISLNDDGLKFSWNFFIHHLLQNETMIPNVVLIQGTNKHVTNKHLPWWSGFYYSERRLIIPWQIYHSMCFCVFIKNNKDLSNVETRAVKFLTTDRVVQQKLSITVGRCSIDVYNW